ncbi:MAG: hypothetical protein KAI17_22920, partial [Thiotrichaceae bacterium]|nr:hypothetical protein [Thiotrichaceae bacterium]
YEPATGRYMTADPIGLEGGINLYVYVGANPVNYWDFNGLSVDGTGTCTDDAGVSCCCSSIREIELRIDDSDMTGHAFLHTPGMTVGFYPSAEVSGSDYFSGTNMVPGEVEDDSGHIYNPSETKKYKVCPETLTKLAQSARDHRKDDYQLGNRVGRNCAGWACGRLENSGLTPPLPSDTNMLRPHDLRR